MRFNWPIWIMAMLYGIVETRYFGWNLHPSSDAEIICDGITILIGALAFFGTCKRSAERREGE